MSDETPDEPEQPDLFGDDYAPIDDQDPNQPDNPDEVR
jgi:hypothetical protein